VEGSVNAGDRIAKEFDRLLAMGKERAAKMSAAEQVVWVLVLARCEKDMNGFESVYEQALKEQDLKTLVKGLRKIGERRLAKEFASSHELLQKDGFYGHYNWNKVPKKTKQQILDSGDRIGDQLWQLDEKLVSLLDGEIDSDQSH